MSLFFFATSLTIFSLIFLFSTLEILLKLRKKALLIPIVVVFIFLRNEKKIARVHSKIQNNDAEEIISIFLSKKKNSPVEATLIGILII